MYVCFLKMDSDALLFSVLRTSWLHVLHRLVCPTLQYGYVPPKRTVHATATAAGATSSGDDVAVHVAKTDGEPAAMVAREDAAGTVYVWQLFIYHA